MIVRRWMSWPASVEREKEVNAFIAQFRLSGVGKVLITHYSILNQGL